MRRKYCGARLARQSDGAPLAFGNSHSDGTPLAFGNSHSDGTPLAFGNSHSDGTPGQLHLIYRRSLRRRSLRRRSLRRRSQPPSRGRVKRKNRAKSVRKERAQRAADTTLYATFESRCNCPGWHALIHCHPQPERTTDRSHSSPSGRCGSGPPGHQTEDSCRWLPAPPGDRIPARGRGIPSRR